MNRFRGIFCSVYCVCGYPKGLSVNIFTTTKFSQHYNASHISKNRSAGNYNIKHLAWENIKIMQKVLRAFLRVLR